MFYMRLISKDISLEDDIALIKAVHEVKVVTTATYKQRPVLEITPRQNVSNSRMKVLLANAMKPYQVNIWKRPDPPIRSRPARRR